MRGRDRGREEEKNREGEREEIKKQKEKYVLLNIFYFVEFCTKKYKSCDDNGLKKKMHSTDV